jgi:NAD(P)-dependent dehydrogenase (short-subunit alcohol dehydrogenase family)
VRSRRRLDTAARRYRTGVNNAAVQNLTVALANELGKDGILVHAIVPTRCGPTATTRTSATPWRRPANPRPRC